MSEPNRAFSSIIYNIYMRGTVIRIQIFYYWYYYFTTSTTHIRHLSDARDCAQESSDQDLSVYCLLLDILCVLSATDHTTLNKNIYQVRETVLRRKDTLPLVLLFYC